MKEKTIFPREEKSEVLFDKILNDPWAYNKLFQTFCNNLFCNDDSEAILSPLQFTEALFNCYSNKDLSAFLMAITQNTMFDLLRNSFLIPYRFNADGKQNPIIMTDDKGMLLPEFANSVHEKDYQHFYNIYKNLDNNKNMFLAEAYRYSHTYGDDPSVVEQQVLERSTGILLIRELPDTVRMKETEAEAIVLYGILCLSLRRIFQWHTYSMVRIHSLNTMNILTNLEFSFPILYSYETLNTMLRKQRRLYMPRTNYTDIMEKNHMEIPWHDYTDADSNALIANADLIEKASVIGRVGLIMLSCGTGAWRVRTSMNKLSKELGVTCTVDVGLMSIEFNCFDGNDCVSQSLSIANTGVNTSKLYRMEQFVDNFPNEEAHLTGEMIHKRLDEIEQIHTLYSPVKLGLAAALACCGFTFLLGGGPIEMLFAFIAAGTGNLIRTKLIKHHFTLFMNIAVSISASCLIYAILLKLAILMFNIPSVHEAGYICSMLFIIPGFPFITSGIDLAKLDLRSGIERLTYSIIIVLVATVFAWIMALLLHLQPEEFTTLHIGKMLHLILRLIASFCGVFGFSIMFNSSVPMAAMAALIGCIANTLRLELVDFTGMPAAAAAFIGAATAGLLASFIKNYNGYPRISLTVPSIVIMVPGLYLYRAIYNFGIMSLTEAVSWFTSAIMIIVALPLGLIFARIITDRTFRYCT